MTQLKLKVSLTMTVYIAHVIKSNDTPASQKI